jgi:hypothetical protein
MTRDIFIGASIVLGLAALMVLVIFLSGVIDLVKAIRKYKRK